MMSRFVIHGAGQARVSCVRDEDSVNMKMASVTTCVTAMLQPVTRA